MEKLRVLDSLVIMQPIIFYTHVKNILMFIEIIIEHRNKGEMIFYPYIFKISARIYLI